MNARSRSSSAAELRSCVAGFRSWAKERRSWAKPAEADVESTAMIATPARIAWRTRVTGPSLGRDPRGQRIEVTRVHVGDEGVAELGRAPHDHVEAPVDRAVNLGRGPRLRSAHRPREPVRAKDEQRDRMKAACIHEHGGLPVPEIADGAPLERELGVALERYPRREVQPPLEPRLHPMDVAALDVERMLAGEHA